MLSNRGVRVVRAQNTAGGSPKKDSAGISKATTQPNFSEPYNASLLKPTASSSIKTADSEAYDLVITGEFV
jgi:hypothetical protein